MQTTTTTDQAEGETPADAARPAAPPAGHRLRPARRRRPARPAAGAGLSDVKGRLAGLRTPAVGGRLRGIRATQTAFDGETRMRRLLTAVLLAELVLVIVLGAAQAWLGLLVALLAAAVIVAAIMVFGPHDETAQAQGDNLDQVVAAQKEELAALQQRATDAEASTSLLAELARRHRSLLVRQLTKIDQLEAKETDPAALGELFALDHLATRMRRCSEGVLLLSGLDEHRTVGAPVAASEVLRGAVAEVEDFSRVEVSLDRDVPVAGEAVVDVVHLLAELIENATVYSSPTTTVRVRGHVTGDAFAVTVTDQGVGMDPERLAGLNRALSQGDLPPVSGQVGFPVVARLAARQGVYVGLTATAEGGTEATVVLPAALVGDNSAPSAAVPAAPLPPVVAATVPPPPPVAPPTAPTAYVPLTDGPSEDAAPSPSYEQPDEQFYGQPAANEQYAAPAYEQTYQPSSEPRYEQTYEPSYQPVAEQDPQPFDQQPLDQPAYDQPAYDQPAYDQPAYDQPDDQIAVTDVDGWVDPEPELAWAMPSAPAPAPDASGWSESTWAEATQPATFVPPAHVEELTPAPLAPRPEAAAPVSAPPAPPEPPAAEPQRVEESQTPAGLARRIPLTNMAPQIAAPEHTLADDVASEPTPDRSRHLFAAYHDGLTLGRNGLTDDRADEPYGDVR